VEKGGVSEKTYKEYVEKYNQFLGMERTGVADSFDPGHYYRIHNVWFSQYYATANTSSNQVEPKTKNNDDTQLWQVVKNNDATVVLINKATQTAAYISSDATDQMVRLGKPYDWTLEERTLDGKTGICIIDGKGGNSWYVNADVWGYILMKPFWGASTWTFEKTEEVVTGLDQVLTNGQASDNKLYDLGGRQITTPAHGVYINDRGEKHVK
jgi:hypothetical protein